MQMCLCVLCEWALSSVRNNAVHVRVHPENVHESLAPFGLLVSSMPQVFLLKSSVPVSGAVVCVTLLDRLKGDQITASPEQLKAYSDRPQLLVCRVIKQRLGIIT